MIKVRTVDIHGKVTELYLHNYAELDKVVARDKKIVRLEAEGASAMAIKQGREGEKWGEFGGSANNDSNLRDADNSSVD